MPAPDLQSVLDPSVLQALAKWPNVPHCYGWLRLDRRGRWLLGGDVLRHNRAIDFINRNYTCDPSGCWFFQNGPQRVYVELDYVPWVYRLHDKTLLETHTGRAVDRIAAAHIVADGDLLLESEHGIGIIHDADLALALDYLVTDTGASASDEDVEAGLLRAHNAEPTALFFRWGASDFPIEPVAMEELENRFSFVREPKLDQAGTE